MNKKILWILMLSLAGNIFLLGTIVGTNVFPGPKRPPPHMGRMLEEMADILPPADAAILRNALQAHGNELNEPFEDPGRRRDRIREVLLAEPFDVEAFKQVNSEFHARHQRVGQVIGQILAEAVPQMSSEGRKRLAEFRPPPPPK